MWFHYAKVEFAFADLLCCPYHNLYYHVTNHYKLYYRMCIF